MRICPAQCPNADHLADATDPSLLRKHSTFQSYRTATTTYPSIRTFYHEHPHASKLPNKPKPLPLLVFIHGLGGSLAQFSSLLTTLVNSAPCFGIDLPGCGRSRFELTRWGAYSHKALVELLAVAIQQACDASGTQEVILVGHSLGCSMGVSLAASGTSIPTTHKFEVVGMIAVCPKAFPLTPAQTKAYGKILKVPTLIFDLWRAWDRRGGLKSPSVLRFVGPGADEDTKKLQLRFNEQSRTGVWRRVAWGNFIEPGGGEHGVRAPDPEMWATLRVPLLIVSGASDPVTTTEDLTLISKALSVQGYVRYHEEALKSDASARSSDPAEAAAAASSLATGIADKTYPEAKASGRDSKEPNLILKTYVLPKPASHALLYDRSTYRLLSGLIQPFIADEIDERLSLGWQLLYLKDTNKWDVKNLAKWKAVGPVSDPIAGIFRAMKTLREVDEAHSPPQFVRDWKDQIKAVIDISHESPVYNPAELEAGGIEYHKFPTVSKLPPTAGEVEEFMALVDRLRSSAGGSDPRLVGVHCHYGFNRTGFFICAYLIQREGYGVQQALDEFQARRGPGIRHEHFIDTLFVRYCVGLRRPSVTHE